MGCFFNYIYFVWDSFYKTQKALKKYEREFANEINELSAEKRKSVVENSKIASQVLSSHSKTI